MLTIKTEENWTSALAELGMSAEDGCTVMTVKDGQELLGAGVMRLFDTHVVIEDICIREESEDFALGFGLGKTLLNVADLRGIRHAVSSKGDMDRLLKALRFKSTRDEGIDMPEELRGFDYYLNLTGYFDANC